MCKTFLRLAITKYINVEITEDAAAADLLRYITPTSIWMIYAQLVQDIRRVLGGRGGAEHKCHEDTNGKVSVY